MNIKKCFPSFAGICVLLLIITTLWGCQMDPADSETNKELSMKDQFKVVGKLRDEKQVTEMIQYGVIGNSPENALVPLIFHKDGSLYTATEYNASFSPTDAIQGFYTDLQTFAQLVKLSEATSEYSREMPIENGKNV